MKEMKKVILILSFVLFLIFNPAAAQTSQQQAATPAITQAATAPAAVKAEAKHIKKPASSANDFSIKGSNLMMDKQVVKMTGVSASYMATLDEKQIDSAFAAFKQADVKIVKILASYRGDKPYAFETGFGKYNEEAFKKLDYIVSAAAKNSIKLIVALCDNNPDYGGKKAYRQWTGGSNDNVLFQDKISREYYKMFAARIISRQNTVTGIKYSDDPAVLAWDLCNGTEDENDADGSMLYAWAGEMSSYIKSIDKNHFVTISVKQPINSADRINSFDLFLIPDIDFAYYNASLEEKGDLKATIQAVIGFNSMFYKNVNKPVIMGFSDYNGSAMDAFEISKVFFDFGTALIYNNSGMGDYAKKPGVFDIGDEKTIQAFKEAAKSGGIMNQETSSITISDVKIKEGKDGAIIDFAAKPGAEACIFYGEELPLRAFTDKITLKDKKAGIKLEGLKPETKYMFIIKASDQAEAGISQVFSFKTKKLVGMTARPFSTSSNFIKAKGADFYDGNKVYKFLGSENYYLRYSKYMDYAKKYNHDITGYIFSEAKKIGLKNMRVFTMQEGESMDTINKELYTKEHRYLRIGPDFFDEQAYKNIDSMLDSAKKHGMRITLCFVDNWDYNGGAKILAKWAGVAKDGFWTNDKAKEYYRQSVQKLVLRKNTVNGILYKDDPTIFAWDLCNEPWDRDDTSAKTMAAWISEMAAYVKSLDKNHMVTAGLEGYYLNNGQHYSGTDFILCQQSKDIDFTTFHIYPASEWNHYSKSTVDFLLKRWIKDSHEVLKKPIVMEEFGIAKGQDEYPRADWINFMLNDFYTLGGNGADYWFLVDPDYPWGDGNEFTANDIDIVNTFIKYADEINKKGY